MIVNEATWIVIYNSIVMFLMEHYVLDTNAEKQQS
jgi:hypothetical protein